MNERAGSDGYRSREWFGRRDLDGFLHRSWLKSEGYTDEAFAGRPVIGICNSWSELVNCNVHLRGLAESVKRGVLAAGGFPLEFPVMSLGESLMKPTTMLYRNLMAMDVEESIRANPLDGVVLLTGCDKTNPASILGAASANLPAIVVTGGPMLNGHWRGEELGSCSDCWHYNEEHRAGRITAAEFEEIENALSRSNGHCMTMGTASTPWLVDLKPAGRHLMEDFYYAGGLPAVMAQIADLLHLDAITVSGRTIGENIAGAAIVNEDVIRPREKPLDEGGSLVVLYGSLCPDGA